MRPMAVVVPDVDVQDALELRTAEDQDPIETFAPQRADEAFGVRVGARCPDWRSDDLDALASEHLVEGAGELTVAIVNQETSRRGSLGERPRELARLLGDPACVRISGRSGEVDPARRD